MKHPETHLVTTEHGPRPLGKPNRCFYCGRPIGAMHKEPCVCRERTVMVKLTVEVCVKVPENWTTDQINFHYNESSWCASNIMDHLKKVPCLCDIAEFEYVRESLRKDENTWSIKFPGCEALEGEPPLIDGEQR